MESRTYFAAVLDGDISGAKKHLTRAAATLEAESLETSGIVRDRRGNRCGGFITVLEVERSWTGKWSWVGGDLSLGLIRGA